MLSNQALCQSSRRGVGRAGRVADTGWPPLEVFVTATDFHDYPHTIRSDDPPVITEPRHRQVLAFGHAAGRDDFAADDMANTALAFAARATSSLPGGVAAVDFAAFQQALRRHAGTWRPCRRRR